MEFRETIELHAIIQKLPNILDFFEEDISHVEGEFRIGLLLKPSGETSFRPYSMIVQFKSTHIFKKSIRKVTPLRHLDGGKMFASRETSPSERKVEEKCLKSCLS